MKNLLKSIEKNYRLSKQDVNSKIYSEHWKIFSSNFLKHIKSPNYWENFLNNEEGNPSIQILGKEMNQSLSDFNLNRKKKYKLSPNIKKKIVKRFNMLKKKVGIDFIKKHNEGQIGNPKAYYYKKLYLTKRDLNCIYYAWRIQEIQTFLSESPIIVEIGGGIGYLPGKLKKIFPTAKIILIDLPEVICMQRFYLYKLLPKAKVFDYAIYKKKGLNSFFRNRYDFAFLPPDVIKDIKNKQIDLVINTLSMMEMDKEVVKNYMFQINRIVKNKGFFYCVNRYRRSTDNEIKIKEYNFDDYWYFIENQKFFLQPWIHEILARRTNIPNFYSPKKTLSQLHPLYLKDIYPNLKEMFFLLF